MSNLLKYIVKTSYENRQSSLKWWKIGYFQLQGAYAIRMVMVKQAVNSTLNFTWTIGMRQNHAFYSLSA